ncbi:AraC family transcriptional regulator [Billgrantia montanilacus]|nr:AraC family transcriptional regulator [Halomonas montanilacus]
MDKVSDQRGHALKENHSKFAIQIIGAYHKWQRRGISEPEATNPPIEAALLEKEAHEIWELALNLSDDEHLGLNAGKALVQHLNGHFLTTLTANSKTVGEALEHFCQYHELYSDVYHPKLVRRPNTAAITVTDPAIGADEAVRRHMCECMFSAIVTILDVLCKQPVSPSAVHFSWPSPFYTAAHESVLKAPVHFDSSITALEFANATLDTPIPYADELLLSTLLQYADTQLDALQEPDSWKKKIRSIVSHPGLSLNMDINTVARNFGISSRTLQQRLKSEGVRFQEIVREVKKEMAKGYLTSTTIPISEIALLLGYSEQSAFNHAFKTWTGLTPRQYRKSSSP